MPDYRLTHAVTDLKGNQLLAAGTRLTGQVMETLVSGQPIGEALETGEATAFLSEKNIHHGVDRVIAVFDDGRAYAWHQLNNCGDTDYTGSPRGEECPPREETN